MLLQEWETLRSLEFLEPRLDHFRQRLRLTVCRDYPWLVSELYDLEGLLGWGPGFRDYDGDFFPPPMPGSSQKMREFLEVLSRLPRDALLPDLIRDAARDRCSSRCSRLLSVALCARKGCRHSVVDKLYGKIAEAHSPYVLGGARLYLFMWLLQQRYALAAAGLSWLLHNPISKLKARAETVRRRRALWQSTEQAAYEIPQAEPVVVQWEVLHNAC